MEALCVHMMAIVAAFAREGFAIITGGGPGIKEAANRWAQDGRRLSIGCNVELPFCRR